MSYSHALEKTATVMRQVDQKWTPREMAVLEAMVRQAYPDPDDHEPMIGRLHMVPDLTKRALSGDTYYWAPEICDLIAATAPSLPAWTLRPESLPSPSGVFWFGRPLAWSLNRELRESRSVSNLLIGSESYLQEDTVLDGIAWAHYGSPYDQVAVLPFERTSQATYPVLPIRWPVGTDSDTAISFFDDEGPSFEFVLRAFGAMLAFVEQRILVASKRDADRATRRRLARELSSLEPVVRVVELRKRQAREVESDTHKAVEWSCRWLVSGHWRQQYYPSSGARRPIWIMPFVKGDPTKPFNPPKPKIFAVVR